MKLFSDQCFECFLPFYAGLVHEDCIAKMRLISLVDLGSNETGRVPYSHIKDTLRVGCVTFLLLLLLYLDIG